MVAIVMREFSSKSLPRARLRNAVHRTFHPARKYAGKRMAYSPNWYGVAWSASLNTSPRTNRTREERMSVVSVFGLNSLSPAAHLSHPSVPKLHSTRLVWVASDPFVWVVNPILTGSSRSTASASMIPG
jgi:hypothetical protein